MKKTKFLSVVSSLVVIGGALASCGSDTGSAARKYKSETVSNPDVTVGAGGVKTSFKGSSASEKQKILGLLEKYAYENNLTGISLFENGGYQVFSDTVKLPTENYVTGYGFGTLRYGSITSDLSGESKAEWKRYYHSYLTDDPASMNYMDDKGSVVGGLIGYSNSAYFGQALNSTKDEYKWEGDLSNDDRPTPLDDDYETTGVSKTFRFEVKVGSQLKYNTMSSNATLAKYKDREVEIDDYLTPFALLWSKSVGYARAAENLTSSTGFHGANEYYNKASGVDLELFKETVGISAYEEDGKGYIEFELNEATTPFMAMYYVSSSMYAPVPLDFIKDLGDGDVLAGAKIWGKFTDGGLTPVDTTLSTGPYVLETWEKDKQIVFKKNSNYYAAEGEYNIEGVHLNILPAQKSDQEAAIKEFEAGKLSACGVPSTKLTQYKTDPRTKVAEGDSVFKLNVNSCDSSTWEALFGENGTITQTPKSQYWEVEPMMSNDDFLLGLSYAINRTEFADKRGVVASVDYFSNAYLIDPENGVSYDSTDEHKAAVASRTANGQYADGYSLTLAQEYFANAAKALTESGAYKSGDTVKIEIAWQTTSNITGYGADIEKYWEEAFNSSEAKTKYGLTLDVENYACAVWSDVYYKKMMVGQFDIGFGSISGNTYDPLNFMEVLRSDNTSGFTLNWGTDTNVPGIEYNGVTYSFNALWQATDTLAYIGSDGSIVSTASYFNAALWESLHDEEKGTRSVKLKTAVLQEYADQVSVDEDSFTFVGHFGDYTVNLVTDDFSVEVKDGEISFVVPAGIEAIFDSIDVSFSYSYDYTGEVFSKTIPVAIIEK